MASMVLGIVTLAVGSYLWFGFVTAIIGLVLGVSGRKKALEAGAPTGTATAGIVMCIIGLVLSIAFTISCFACLAYMGSYDYYGVPWYF